MSAGEGSARAARGRRGRGQRARRPRQTRSRTLSLPLPSPPRPRPSRSDTVGDPFKDTAGPSLHVVIKLLSTCILVLGPLFVSRQVGPGGEEAAAGHH